MMDDLEVVEELKELLEINGYRTQRMVIVPDAIWRRLKNATKDPLTIPPWDDSRVALWWRNRTYVVRKSDCLNLCEMKDPVIPVGSTFSLEDHG